MISIKNAGPLHVVYLEQVGPYWTLGPLYAQLRDYREELNQTGSLFARYLDNPLTSPPQALRTQIGFVMAEDIAVKPPYKAAEWEGRLVAYLYLNGPNLSISRNHVMLQTWANHHGFEPAGPLTEFHPTTPTNANGEGDRTEVQLVVRKAAPAKGEMPESGPSHGGGTVSADPASTPSTTIRLVDRSPVAEGSYVPLVITLDGDAPSEGVRKAARTYAATSPMVEPSPTESTTQSAATPQRIDELLLLHQYDEVAGRIMLHVPELPPPVHLWLGQAVFRIAAVAQGVEKVYPGEGQELLALSAALSRGYRKISAPYPQNPLDHAVVRLDTPGDRRAAAKRELIRDLDVLLAHIAAKTVNARTAQDQLGDLLQRLSDLL